MTGSQINLLRRMASPSHRTIKAIRLRPSASYTWREFDSVGTMLPHGSVLYKTILALKRLGFIASYSDDTFQITSMGEVAALTRVRS